MQHEALLSCLECCVAIALIDKYAFTDAFSEREIVTDSNSIAEFGSQRNRNLLALVLRSFMGLDWPAKALEWRFCS